MNPIEIIQEIIDGNTRFRNTHPTPYFESFSHAQNPYITIISCSDSRVPLNVIMPDTANRVFSIQNIGNQVLSSEGSVDYGIYHLNTPVLMIMGHSDCGAIKAYTEGFLNETSTIRHELDFLKPMVKGNDSEDNRYQHISLNIEHNIDYQVNIAFKKYKERVDAGKLIIIGLYYDFNNDFEKGKGQIIIVNINRIKKPDDMLSADQWCKISPANRQLFTGRL